ncbi:alpha/beta hydrolase [uncultured Pseudokineococcus sp.]|uniref:alpha/beta hydrolase n=1 Tax=uncultured Pseudokineococcus sp. TaxID=1642928 RepID=UPI002616ABBD|nr:alpha/beta fold hydrolase [uncultured Pseudokineococcus sp.]
MALGAAATAAALVATLGAPVATAASARGGGPATAPGSAPSASADRGAAAVPDLTWGVCPPPAEVPGLPPVPVDPRFECATAAVPLDHDDPGGPTIDLALRRLPAADPGARIGSLFLNPGGPGGSGYDFVEAAELAYDPEVVQRFDLVGFDPRGVARSTPLTCFSDPEDALALLSVPAFPLTTQEEVAVTRAYRGYTSACAQDTDVVLDHMSTADVARDLDLLRAAVGDERLTYAGYSYGSQLGTTYANLFPDRVRALVVDGVLDPVAWTTGESPAEAATLPFSTRIASAEGADDTLGAFFAECSAAGPQACALADGDPAQRYAAVVDALREEPVQVDAGDGTLVPLTYQDVVGLTLSVLYDPTAWPLLAQVVVLLEELVAAGGESDQVALGDARDRAGAAWALLRETSPSGREAPAEEDEAVQLVEGFDGVACLDSDDPLRQRAWEAAGEAAEERAPYFGRLWTWRSLACATWPGRSDDRYAGPWDAETAAPVLVVGTRFDPATRYEGAQAVADLLPSSRLLTLEGWGHTSLGASSCVDAAVASYLVDGAVPAEGATCEADRRPFDALPQVRAAQTGPSARDQVHADNLPAGL